MARPSGPGLIRMRADRQPNCTANSVEGLESDPHSGELPDPCGALSPLTESPKKVPHFTYTLSDLGRQEEVGLTSVDGAHRLSATLPGITTSGSKSIRFRLEQQTAFDRLLTVFEHGVGIFPSEDLVLLGEGLAPAWKTSSLFRSVEVLNFEPGMPVYDGETALPLVVETPSPGLWVLILSRDAPLDLLGYRAVGFAFHPGDTHQLPADEDRLQISVRPGEALELLESRLVSLDREEWQVVEVPLTEIATDEHLESIRIAGDFDGTIYLDDIRLVADPPPQTTAVVEDNDEDLPEGFELEQNYPNPFNSSTVIRFALPVPAPVELAVYNLMEQKGDDARFGAA